MCNTSELYFDRLTDYKIFRYCTFFGLFLFVRLFVNDRVECRELILHCYNVNQNEMLQLNRC